MAWNDVYSNDNGVHLLVTVGGRSYNFSKAVDLKVERKIGDTLSKFSLGIIDDGTNTFQEFEQVLTNKFVNIDIAYGNSSKTLNKFTGFVVDYQPSFLGPSSKLTVSGYVFRLHSGTKKLTSLYNYWINWSPVVGARKETDKPWAMIYDGVFKFNSDMSDAAKDVTEGTLWDGDEATAEALIKDALSSYFDKMTQASNAYDDILNTDPITGKPVKAKVATENGALIKYKDGTAKIFWGWDKYMYYWQVTIPEKDRVTNLSPNIPSDIASPKLNTYTPPNQLPPLGNSYTPPGLLKPPTQNNTNTNTAPLYAPYDPTVSRVIEIKTGMSYREYSNGNIEIAGPGNTDNSAINEAHKEYKSAKDAYEKLQKQLNGILSKDTLSNRSGKQWDYGHVPWKYDIISKYGGNVKFKEFTHNGNSIARVIPDIFIPWDKTWPITLVDDPDKIKKDEVEKKLGNFEDGVVCDITMFGLKFTFYKDIYLQGDVNNAYVLSLYDKHGTLRVFKANENYYIWVGDIPELYEKFKKYDWNYQDGAIEVNLKEDKILSNYTNETFKDDGTIQYDLLEPDKTYKPNRMIATGKVKEHEDYFKMSDAELDKLTKLNNNIPGSNFGGPYSMLELSDAGYADMTSYWKEYALGNRDDWGYKDEYKKLQEFLTNLVKKHLSGNKLHYLYTDGPMIDEARFTRYITICWGVKPGKDKKGNLTNNSFDGAKNDKHYIKYTIRYKEIEKFALVQTEFKTSELKNGFIDFDTLSSWQEREWEDIKQYCYVASGNKDEMTKGPDYHDYTMTDLKEDKEKGIKAMTKEERVTKFLMAAYRSGEIMNYGKVYISDIVAQLCELEGWKNPKIVSTTATDYKDSCLDMGGVSALEYISTTLCENAVEAGGLGRAGFTCYFDKYGTFHFEPVNAYFDKNSKTLQIGYNINNSNVLSFTCRSKGKELMLEMETDLSGYNMLTGENVSASVSRQDLSMSTTERKLYNQSKYAKDTNGDGKIDNSDEITETVWFNLPLFNYYGYQQDVNNYESFTKNIASNNEISWGTNLVRRYYKSSLENSTNTALKALNDLTQLKNSPLKAELTMIGDNEIVPGSYIYILNHAKNGFHYTSGYYFIRQITDSVTTGNGYTQSLDLLRYSDTVYNMTTNIELQMIANSSYENGLREAVDYLKTGQMDKFNQLYKDMCEEGE